VPVAVLKGHKTKQNRKIMMMIAITDIYINGFRSTVMDRQAVAQYDNDNNNNNNNM